MNPWTLVGLVASVVVAGAVTAALPRLHPRVGSYAIVLSIISITMSSIWLVSAPAVAFLLHTSTGGTFVEWCRSWLPHSDVPAWVGLPALAVLSAQGLRTARRLRALRSEARAVSHGSPLTIVRSEEPVALTTPGRSGRIIVSTAMLRLLSPGEQRAMLAHERAHLECRHDRFLVVAELAVVAIPPLALLQRLLRRSLERWANERAAAETGDRSALARAISVAALATAPPSSLTSAIASNDVAARLWALDRGQWPANNIGSLTAAAATLGITATVALASIAGVGFQFHYLAELVVHVCPF